MRTLIMKSRDLESTAKALPQPVRACPNREAVRYFLGVTCNWDRTIQRWKTKDGRRADEWRVWEEKSDVVSYAENNTSSGVRTEFDRPPVRQTPNKRVNMTTLLLLLFSCETQWADALRSISVILLTGTIKNNNKMAHRKHDEGSRWRGWTAIFGSSNRKHARSASSLRQRAVIQARHV